MRDYAKLIKALRFAFDQPCYSCVLGEKCNWGDFCFFKRSADAIEELLKKNDELENSGRVLMATFARAKEKMPHWISVEERLPEFHMNDSGCVCTRNVVFRTEHKTVHLGYVIRTAHNIETVGGFEQILMDRWYDQTGDMIEGVTHWMPLPEPPKEDAK